MLWDPHTVRGDPPTFCEANLVGPKVLLNISSFEKHIYDAFIKIIILYTTLTYDSSNTFILYIQFIKLNLY